MTPSVVAAKHLLTARQCLSKAAEMEARAELCNVPRHAADFVNMARCWRVVAAQAAQQDVTL